MKINGVGNLIKDLRADNNLTQKDLGDKIGFSARTVSDWENGKTEPNLAVVKALSKIFDIPYEEFFDQVEDIEIKLIDKGTF